MDRAGAGERIRESRQARRRVADVGDRLGDGRAARAQAKDPDEDAERHEDRGSR